MEDLSFKSFLEEEKAKYIDRISNDLAHHIRHKKKSESRAEHRHAIKRLKNTEEFQKQLLEYLNTDERYQTMLDTDKAEKDPKLLNMYQMLLVEEERKREEQLLADRKETFFGYIAGNKNLQIEAADAVRNRFTEEYKKKLMTERLYISDGYEYPFYEKRPLKLKDYDYFIEYEAINPEAEYEEYIRNLDFQGIVLQYLKEKDREGWDKMVSKVMDGLDEMTWDDFVSCQTVHDWILDYADYFMEKVYDIYGCISPEEADALIRKNPYYKNMLEEADRKKREEEERELRLNNAILDRIPQNPIDLFPEARKLHRHFILHIGSTNSGKTHDAVQALEQAETGIYLGPLRLLAFEAYETMNNNGVPCSLVTGEEQFIVENAYHTASTVEVLDTMHYYDLAVIDEAQMINDNERGWAWTTAILGACADTIHVCLAPEAEELIVKLIDTCGDEYEIIRHERMTSLTEDPEQFNFPKSVKDHDALIVFSKWDVIRCAAELQRNGIQCSIIYGALPYEVRQSEVHRFIDGETNVIVATDAIGMGMNLPIKRIVFLQNTKFDGTERRTLNTAEIKQIAGRAGRKGIFNEGTYTFQTEKKKMRKIISSDVPSITAAPLGFPQYLLTIEEPLSQIMAQWMKMEDDGIFIKSDLTIQYGLCKELEKETDDKQLIYSFITIPFDEENPDLKNLWQEMFHLELSGRHMEFSEPPYNPNSLESMELAYKTCDLMFFYLRKFTDGSELNRVMDYKKKITDAMTGYLKKQKLPTKKCKYCGCPLPWNYMYSMCEKCHDKRYGFYDYY